MTAGTKQAIDDAISYMAETKGLDIEEILADSTDGWQTAEAIEKGLSFIKFVRHNDGRLNAFIAKAGYTLSAPNLTRWNPWFNALRRLYK